MKIELCLFIVGLSLVQRQIEAATTTTYACVRGESLKCVIPSVIISEETTDIQLPDLNGKSTLQIKSGNISHFDERFCSQLGTVTKLYVGALGIKQLLLKPELVEVKADRNSIESFQLKSDGEYKTEILDLSKNRLTSLDGFEKLSNVKELFLQGNLLATVDMKTFEKMTALVTLNLGDNQISEIVATNMVTLPLLDSISLVDNKLDKLVVRNWDFESLTDLDLSSNQLVHIEGLQDGFASLSEIALAGNSWYCSWLADVLNHFNASYVTVKDSDKDCEGLSPANICCVAEHDANEKYDEHFQKLDKLEQQQTFMLQKLNSRVSTFENEHKDRLSRVQSQLVELLKKEVTNIPITDTDKTDKEAFLLVKEKLETLQSDLENEKKNFEKQIHENNGSQRKLGISIVELRLALEREKKKMVEVQQQFGMLKSYVISKQAKRNGLAP
ncbi:uncharacterized protein LOC131693859 [Topomyia yanbarensis]|uniref:uncharacterized protein LOC131693859 n=1 Tax=Topomyia yanbarensis TaxID=2498891 RepID=UPI00273C1E25|nr:uncharacterized protein LOC131693859 [Topomyia yanbarensis]